MSPTTRAKPGFLLALLVMLLWSANIAYASVYTGKVFDSATQQPITNAIVTMANTSVQTLQDGTFRIEGDSEIIGVRAYGYSRLQMAVLHNPGGLLEIPLRSITPRAVYLSLPGLEDPALREEIVKLPETTHINALVIDVKNKHGHLVFSHHPGYMDVNRKFRDMKELLFRLQQNGLYAIARIAVFKDEYLAQQRPDLALTAEDGTIVRDNDGKAWTDPRNRDVWDYNISIAIEAARQGFDEIQFDYVRFPTVYEAQELTAEVRRASVRGFLAEARAALTPYNVFIAANIFGYASWDPGDTNIGQKLEEIAAEVDYICLMLYPSSFRNGLPTARQPLDHPDRIVSLSLRRAQERTNLPAVRFRPWLQAFPDYSFDYRPFRRQEIAAQVYAAELFGTNGWMLWHPHSIYDAEDLPGCVHRSGQADC